MKIVVCSGKGGTGKTTVATSLALSIAERNETWYLDCDVEAPNGHIFLNPEFNEEKPAVILLPHIDLQQCTACGRCVEVCQYHALALIAQKVLVFPQLCHGCGSCTWNCPEGAISEIPNPIGKLEAGMTPTGIRFVQGVLNIGEPMPTPIIRQLKKWLTHSKETDVVIDSPPGASCSVVESLRGADLALLVTEPTPFGLHDLKQIVGILAEMGIPAGVIINRDGIGNDMVDKYLNHQAIPVLMRIPYQQSLAEGIAMGKPLVEIMPEYSEKFRQLFDDIHVIVNKGAA